MNPVAYEQLKKLYKINNMQDLNMYCLTIYEDHLDMIKKKLDICLLDLATISNLKVLLETIQVLI